jgi:hypothetical protein
MTIGFNGTGKVHAVENTADSTQCIASATSDSSRKQAEEDAVTAFFHLTGSKAEITGLKTYLLYKADTEIALKSAEVESSPRDYFVLIYGSTLSTTGEKQEGLVGRVWVDIATGKPYHIAGSKLPRESLVALDFDELAAQDIVGAPAASSSYEPYLLEVSEYEYAWCLHDGKSCNYVDAIDGTVMTTNEMGLKLQKLQEAIQAISDDAGAAVSHLTLSPIFIEQGMHQDQHMGLQSGDGALCGPTALSMLFDYYGEHIDKLEVADVSTDFGGGACNGTCEPDLMRAAMFSHNSDALWDHNADGAQQDGFSERLYGYTVARANFSADADDQAWLFLTELIQEHCPFIAHISGHYVTVIGYALDDATGDAWVSCADPADADLTWDDWDLKIWDDVDGHFKARWAAKSFGSFAICPMPVEMKFLPDTPVAGQFTIYASVRTCKQYPSSASGSWNCVNRYKELKGDASGSSENCPVTITCPNSVTLVSGQATQYFNPSGSDDAETFSWVFVQDGNERGATFAVTATGWAVGYSSTSYTGQTDELYGSGTLYIDDNIIRIRDSNANTIAAFGDRGNLYLASDVLEWQQDIADTESKEIILRNSDTIVARFSEDGSLAIAQGYHTQMDDLNDSCAENNGNTTEQEYLNNPSTDTLKTYTGENVAVYLDQEGNLRLRGLVMANWTAWNYWD